MKASLAASLGLAIAGLLLAGAAGAQAPGGGPGFGGASASHGAGIWTPGEGGPLVE